MASNREMPASFPESKNKAQELADNTKEVRVKKSAGIMVVAIRKGFFENMRKNEGDQFLVPSLEKVGNWMKCLDSDAEKQHQEMMKERSQKAKEIAAKEKAAGY